MVTRTLKKMEFRFSEARRQLTLLTDMAKRGEDISLDELEQALAACSRLLVKINAARKAKSMH